MKSTWVKIFGISIGVIFGLLIIAVGVYVFVNYPRDAEAFEIISEHPRKHILIATQGSDFKNAFIKTLCDTLKQSPFYVKGIDIKDLALMDDQNWDRILIVNSYMATLNRHADHFIQKAARPENILLMVTSGGADWQPEAGLDVDAITTASRKTYIPDIVDLIKLWVQEAEDQAWESQNYVLSLMYFPRANVKLACETIEREREHYKLKYPALVKLINQAGYMYLRIDEIDSAIAVFRLNVSLFSETWNVYDSYGEALLKQGDQVRAIKNYQKALKLNPQSTSARNMLEKLGVK